MISQMEHICEPLDEVAQSYEIYNQEDNSMYMKYDNSNNGFDIFKENHQVGFLNNNGHLHIFDFKYSEECENMLRKFNVDYKRIA